MFCEYPVKGFPCGKCRACKLVKANEKMLVSVFAAHEYKTKGQFLTLTFNDKYKPDGLDHSIFQGFMKRLRKADGTPDVKYFMAGEYGESGDEHREHFHVLFYNHRYDMDKVERAWSDPRTGESFGFTYDGTCTPQSIKYVSGYVDKKGYDPESGKRAPYGRTSCNIPDGLTNRDLKKMCLTGSIVYNGRKFSVPHKWRKRYRRLWQLYEISRHGLQDALYRDKPQIPPEQVRAMMDRREALMNIKKSNKRKYRLQKLLHKRIM